MRFSHHPHRHEHGHGQYAGHPGGQHGHPFGHRGRGHFGRHRWGDDEEGRGGRRRRIFDSNELRLVLLKLIADQPRHGYELIRAIEDLTGGAYVPSPGVVYPTLTLLQDMGQITEAPSEGRADGSRKAFSATPDGSEHLASRKEEVEALFARLAALADARERSDGGPVRRAMKNLKMVLIDKLERENVKSESLHEMAALIDEAARKIERL